MNIGQDFMDMRYDDAGIENIKEVQYSRIM